MSDLSAVHDSPPKLLKDIKRLKSANINYNYDPFYGRMLEAAALSAELPIPYGS